MAGIIVGRAATFFGIGVGVGVAGIRFGTGGENLKESKALTETLDKRVKTIIDLNLKVTRTKKGSLLIDVEAETKEAYDKLLKSYLNGELLAIINKAVQQYAEKCDDPQPVYDEIEIIYFRKESVPAESVVKSYLQETVTVPLQELTVAHLTRTKNEADNNESDTESDDSSSNSSEHSTTTETHYPRADDVCGENANNSSPSGSSENPPTRDGSSPDRTSGTQSDATKEQPSASQYFTQRGLHTERESTFGDTLEYISKQLQNLNTKQEKSCVEQQKLAEEQQRQGEQINRIYQNEYSNKEQEKLKHNEDDFNNRFLLKGEPFYDDKSVVKVYIIYMKRGETKQPLCAKIINKNICESTNEEELLLLLKDAHVVHFYGLWPMDVDQSHAFVMELCCTTVEDYLKKPQNWIDIEKGEEVTNERDIQHYLPISHLEILKQSTLGLQYLHSEDIIHRNIKPNNFFVTDKAGEAIVKIGDFRLSLQRKNKVKSSAKISVCGTEMYMPPEAFETDEEGNCFEKNITLSYDIFSFGLMWYFVLTNGKGHPFGGRNRHRCRVTDRKAPTLKLEAFGGSLSKEQKITARELVRQMLEFDPGKRCTIEYVYKHPVFWEASKKCRFLVDAQKYIETELIKVTESSEGVEINFKRCKDDDLHERLNHFNKRLLLDCDQGNNQEKQKFDICLEILPQSVREVTGMHKVRSCRNVEELLTVMGNKASHGNISDPEKKELFGDKKGVEKWKTFLNCFLKGREHLLVHLYQVFEDEKGLNEYY